MKDKSLLLVCFFFITCILPGGCQKHQEPLQTLRIGHAPHDHHAPLFIAAMNPEYFKQHGGVYLREISFRNKYELVSDDTVIGVVEIKSSTGGKKIIRKLSEDHLDLAIGGIPAIINFIDKGSCLRILAPSNAEGSGLVVRKDLPVNSWDEFVHYIRQQKKPIRIGYKIDISVQNLIFEHSLKDSDISYAKGLTDTSVEINLVNLHGSKNLIPALRDGLIDGFVVNQPYPALAEYSEVGKTIADLYELPPEGHWNGSPCCALVGCSKYVQSNPEIVSALVTLFMRANQFINQYPQKAVVQIARWLEIPREVEQKAIPTIKYTIDLDEDWNQGIQFWVQSMVDSGALQGDVMEAYLKGNLEELLYSKETYDKARSNL